MARETRDIATLANIARERGCEFGDYLRDQLSFIEKLLSVVSVSFLSC